MAGHAKARQRALQQAAEEKINRFCGFAQRVIDRPGQAEIDNSRPLRHQTAAGAALPDRPTLAGELLAHRREFGKFPVASRHHKPLRGLPELSHRLTVARPGKQRLLGKGGIGKVTNR